MINKIHKILKRNKSLHLIISGVAMLTLFVSIAIFLSKPDFQKKIESISLLLKNEESASMVIGNARKICFQPSYVTRRAFEAVVGEDINFKEVNSDSEFRLHVFYIDGSSQQVLMGENMIRIDRRNNFEACKNTTKIQISKADDFVLIGF